MNQNKDLYTISLKATITFTQYQKGENHTHAIYFLKKILSYCKLNARQPCRGNTALRQL